MTICKKCNKTKLNENIRIYTDTKMSGAGIINKNNVIIINGEFPINIIIDNIVYSFNRIIGQGTYGLVVDYKNEKNDYIVVKTGDIESDINVIKKLQKSNIKCSKAIIPYATSKGDKYLIMEKMDGDLNSFVESHPENLKNDCIIYSIINQIATIMKCLVNEDIYYTDLKLGNLLYYIDSNNHPVIILGDLGGADNEDGGQYIATYIPYDKRYMYDKKPTDGVFNNPTEKDLSWMIGIIICELLGWNMDAFTWSKISKISENYIPKYTNGIISHNSSSKYKDLIVNTFNINKDKRWNLQQIINFTSNAINKLNNCHHKSKPIQPSIPKSISAQSSQYQPPIPPTWKRNKDYKNLSPSPPESIWDI